MLLAARTPAHSHRSWNRGFPSVKHRHLSGSCKRWVAAAAAAVGQPGSTREGEGTGSEGSSGSSLSSGSSSSSDEDTVAAVLASAGLNPAELEQQAPEAYSELSPVLAQVLADVHTARVARAKGSLQLPAAELMARIRFLALEVGLTAAEIRDGDGRDSNFLYFTLDRARRLHGWLRMQQISTDQLRLASRNYGRLWCADMLGLQRCKEHMQQQLGVTDSQWCKAFTTNPQAVLAPPERMSEVIAWLEAKPLGLRRSNVAKLWLSQPIFFTKSADVLQHRLGQLVSRFALNEGDMRRVVCNSPSMLASRDSDTLLSDLESLLAAEPCLLASIPGLLCNGGFVAFNLNTENLLSKVKFLRDYGFDEEQLSKVLWTCPMVLTSNLKGKTKPTLAALQSVLGREEGLVAAVVKQPSLLVAALETLEGNVGVMKELGLSAADIRVSVGRQPQLFAFDYNSEDFQDKLHYYEVVLGRSPQHVLLKQPSILMTALKKVDRRVSFMELKGDSHHEATLTWIYWSDKQFCEEYEYSVTEFEGWREQWVRSERARLYRLDKAKEPGMSRALRARERRGKAKVAARREDVLAAGEEQG